MIVRKYKMKIKKYKDKFGCMNKIQEKIQINFKF